MLASSNFISIFIAIRVHHLTRYDSDHTALRINLEADRAKDSRKKYYIFRFEEVWGTNPRCEGFVRQLWNNHPTSGTSKLKAMKELSSLFNEYKIGLIVVELKRIEELLKEDARWDPSEEAIKVQKGLEN